MQNFPVHTYHTDNSIPFQNAPGPAPFQPDGSTDRRATASAPPTASEVGSSEENPTAARSDSSEPMDVAEGRRPSGPDEKPSEGERGRSRRKVVKTPMPTGPITRSRSQGPNRPKAPPSHRSASPTAQAQKRRRAKNDRAKASPAVSVAPSETPSDGIKRTSSAREDEGEESDRKRLRSEAPSEVSEGNSDFVGQFEAHIELIVKWLRECSLPPIEMVQQWAPLVSVEPAHL